jgi:hypothetical protein
MRFTVRRNRDTLHGVQYVSNHVARDDEVDICQNMPILIYDLEESLEMFQCFCFSVFHTLS